MRSLPLACALLAATSPAWAGSATTSWFYRRHEHSLISARAEPYKILSYRLEVTGVKAELTIEELAGRDDAKAPTGIVWRSVRVQRYAGTTSTSHTATAFVLDNQDPAAPKEAAKLELGCFSKLVKVAGATAVRIHAGGETDDGAWRPSATTEVQALACDNDITFGMAPGIEWVAVTNNGRGLRAIPKDGSIARPVP